MTEKTKAKVDRITQNIISTANSVDDISNYDNDVIKTLNELISASSKQGAIEWADQCEVFNVLLEALCKDPNIIFNVDFRKELISVQKEYAEFLED